MTLNQTKKVLPSEGNNRVKTYEMEEIIYSHTSGKGLISQIYEELNSIARKQITT